MASMTFKRMAVVATLTTSVILMGGAAFAAPASPGAGEVMTTTGLLPGPVSEATHTARNAEAEADRQVRHVQKNF
ncbi:MAG: hypothetical protein AB1679_08170 [Actinomycetota bacterium]|jgi:hypothetical protein